MNRGSVTTAIAALAFAAAAAVPAAAETPNLVGTWKAVAGEGVVARFGVATEHNAAAAAPEIVPPSDQAWTLVIEKQEGRAFTGHGMSPKGAKQPFVGVVRRDDEGVIIADAEGELTGEYDDGKLDLCWTDDRPGRAVVSCWLFARQ